MTFNMSKEVTRTFNLLALKHEAAKNLSGDEWQAFREIKDKYTELRRYEERAFEIEYKTRFEVARKRLIDKAGENNRDFKHRWFGRDQFDKSAINRQAQRVIRSDHHKAMERLDQRETRDISQLMDRADKRFQSQVRPKPDFEKAVDRRARDGLPKDRRQGRRIGR